MDGFEIHMGVNHMGHFLLTLLLLDHIKKSGSGRIVHVSSSLHVLAKLDLSDIMLENHNSHIGDMIPYANSKLANVLFNRQLAKRIKESGVNTYAVCPGCVKTEILQREEKTWGQALSEKIMLKVFGVYPDQGCQTQVLCAVSKSFAEESGLMYRLEKQWELANKNVDENMAREFWDKSLKYVGLEEKDIICLNLK